MWTGGVMGKARGPWPVRMFSQDAEQLAAFGSSKMVKVPSGARRKPCRALLAYRVNPAIAPERLMAKAMVPWPTAVPAPGASNVVMVVVVPLPFTEWPSPHLPRTRQRPIGRRGETVELHQELPILEGGLRRA